MGYLPCAEVSLDLDLYHRDCSYFHMYGALYLSGVWMCIRKVESDQIDL